MPLAKRALLNSLESLLQVKYPFLSFISRLGSLFDLSVEICNLLFFLFRFLFKATEGYALILVSNLFGLEHALASSHALLDSRKSLVDGAVCATRRMHVLLKSVPGLACVVCENSD